MSAKKRQVGEREIRQKDGRRFVLRGTYDDMNFAEILRHAIRKSGLTQNTLSKEARIPQGAISNFLAGKDIRLTTFTKLANLMGFELTVNPEKTPRPKPK